jgi:hypothetical protein
LGESVLAKVVFHLAAFGFLASLFPLESCSLDHAVDELRHVTRGRRRAEGAKRSFHLGGQAESDFRWCVGGKLPLCSGNYVSKPGLAHLGIVVAGLASPDDGLGLPGGEWFDSSRSVRREAPVKRR